MQERPNLSTFPATLPVTEAAKLLGISRNLGYEAVHKGEIPSLRVGKRILVPTAQLQHLLGGTVGGAGNAAT